MGGASMTPVFALVIVAVLAVLLLLLKTRDQGAEDFEMGEVDRASWIGSENALAPAELAGRIFSPTDREFIRLMPSPRLQCLYLAERRRIASHWVRQISLELSGVMRRHRLSSRQSSNLNVAAETRLFFQYLELKLLCEMLLLSIQLFGPHAVVNLATRAGELYQQIGRSMPDFASENTAAT
jgi:hypothetical protein